MKESLIKQMLIYVSCLFGVLCHRRVVDFYSVTNANKTNHNTTLKKKIKRNNHYIPINRSPFLVNKF
jgi:hypothetical protein